MNNNHKTPAQMLKGDKRRMAMLDRALEGATAQQKARVYGVILRYGIETEDEFFIIFVAIGHLMALVEEAPQNWRTLFDEFERKLDQWSEQNLRTLAAIHQQGKAAERMSQDFLRLSNSIKASSTKTDGLNSDLIKLSKLLGRLSSKLDNLQGESKTGLSQIRELNLKFNDTEEEISSLANQVNWTWSINFGLMVGVIGCIVLFGWSLWRQQNIIQQQNQRLGWLLEKANREECVTGIKPPDDPQCRQFQ